MHTREALAAYREGELEALCAVCGQDGVQSTCPRCRAPLCEAHGVTGDERCASCEEALEAFVQHRRANPLGLRLYFASVVLASVAILVTLHIVERQGISVYWLLPVTLLGGCLPLFVGLYRRWRVRPTFLEETPTERRLELPSPKKADLEAAPRPDPLRDVAIGGFILTLLLPVPLLPIVGLFLCASALSRLRRRRKLGEAFSSVGRTYAIAGVVVGSLVGGCQLVWLWVVLRMPRGLW